MTPVEDMGYKVGDVFEVTSDSEGYHYSEHIGSKVVLVDDDSTHIPEFKDIKDGESLFIHLNDITLVPEEDINPWINWDGQSKECPVPEDAPIAIMFNDGAVGMANYPQSLYWEGIEGACGIVAYRELSPREESPTKGEQGVEEYTGGSVNYYKVAITSPTTASKPYVAECNDIIEALGMNYAEGNIFKAVWRHCAARQSKGKKGYGENPVYDLEKIDFFNKRLLIQNKRKVSEEALQ